MLSEAVHDSKQAIDEARQTTSTDKSFDMIFPMLQFVEGLGAMGAPGRNMSTLNSIKAIISDILMPRLLDSHASGEKQLNDSIVHIDACVTKADQDMAVVAGLNNSAAQAEAAHKTCREEEETENNDKTTTCGALTYFLNHSVYPTIPDPPTVVAMRPIMRIYKCLAIDFEEKDTRCNSSTLKHSDKVAVCNGDQANFESYFCAYRDALVAAATTYTTCYTTSNTSHDRLVKDTKASVDRWKVEYLAIKKIECYLDVWLGDGNVSTVDPSKVTACDSAVVDTSALDIVYPVVPSPRIIDTSLVQEYPGTSNFPERYSSLASHDPSIASCVLLHTTVTTTQPSSSFLQLLHRAALLHKRGIALAQISSMDDLAQRRSQALIAYRKLLQYSKDDTEGMIALAQIDACT
jgi:hypothetical protein